MSMLSEVPSDLQVYLEDLLLRSRSPAFLAVDPAGLVALAGGDLARYGFEGLRCGERAADAVYLLEGLLPLAERLVLSRIEMPSGGFADVHLFPSLGFDYVLLLDATREITEREQVEAALQKLLEALHESENKFRAVFQNSRDAISVLRDGVHVLVNPAYTRMFGYANDEELLGRAFSNLLIPEHRHESGARHWRVMDSDTLYAYETRGIRKDGVRFDVDVLVSSYEWQAETYLLVILRDITDRKAIEAKLLHDAFHDPLTDLPNRALFLDRLQQAINRIPRNPSFSHAVLFLDIDRFKLVNDSLGHLAGDSVLTSTARRLSAAVRAGDTVARIGGDEFTILLEDLKAPEEAFQIAGRLLEEMKRPLQWNGNDVFVTASIGIALSNSDLSNPDELVRAADIAMYQAKSRGQSRYEVFRPEMHVGALTRLRLQSDLHRAIERREIGIYLQPIFSFETNQIAGFEALARWHRPHHGLVMPDDFIPAAEETGLIGPLGESLMEIACQWAAELPDTPPGPVFVSVNLSVHQLTGVAFARRVEEILRRTGLSPQRLCLEITETGLMAKAEAGLRTLLELRELDLSLYLDDFGLGYSSMSYLHRFPIDGLKVHHSFVAHSETGGDQRKIVQTIVNLARDLGLKTIAEGIETTAQMEWLKKTGCDYVQGHLISVPLEPSLARALVQ